MPSFRTPPALLLLVLAGCRGGKGAEPAVIPGPAPVATPTPAQARLMEAATKVEAGDPKLLARVSFFPASRKALMTLCGPSVREADAALRDGATLPYIPAVPDRTNPGRRGFRAIGRTLTWRVEDAIKASSYGAAIDDFLRATRIGFALTGGDASDATLGFTLVDEARAAFVPALPLLSRNELVRLSKGLRAAVDGRPKPERTIAHERDAAMAAVAWLQENAEDSLALRREMGEDGRDLATYLKNEPGKRGDFFRSLVEEVTLESNAMGDLAKLPASERAEDPLPDLDKGRPWRKAARHLGRGMRPVLGMHDLTIARTRILLLTAEIRRTIREKKPAPASLDAFSEAGKRDPYSGGPLRYRTDGDDFLVWSVGANGVDDGGQTDESGRQPDTVLDRTGS